MHRPSIHRRGLRPRSAAAWSRCWARSTACASSAKRNLRPKRSPGISETQPDCVVLDFQLIGGTAVDVLRAVHPGSPEIAFIVLTNHPTPQYRRACMEAGAHSVPGQEHGIRQAQGRGCRMRPGAPLMRADHDKRMIIPSRGTTCKPPLTLQTAQTSGPRARSGRGRWCTTSTGAKRRARHAGCRTSASPKGSTRRRCASSTRS